MAKLEEYELEQVLSFEGKIIGCIETILEENLQIKVIEIVKKYKKYLKEAKGLAVEFVKDKDISYFYIHDSVVHIINECNDNPFPTMFFGVTEREYKKGEIIFKMIISGIDEVKQ